MQIITLTTDYGLRDYSVAAVKGALYRECPTATIVDISHQISPFDIFQTAYILKNAYIHFPKGSIHVIGVDDERTSQKKHLIMHYNGHYFIGADSGIFNLITDNKENMELYEFKHQYPSELFPTLFVFPSIVQQIYNNVPLAKIGTKTEQYIRATYLKPEVNADNTYIYGAIMYIDHYGNAVSNITQELFEEVRQGRSFEVIFKMYPFDKIYKYYSEIVRKYSIEERSEKDGESMLLFNELGYLQISIYRSNCDTVGGAASLLGIYLHDRVSIQFK